MALRANALVTLAQAKSWLDIPPAEAKFDVRVELLINSASERIEQFLERKLGVQTHVERHSGRAQDRLVLEEWPVISISEVRQSGAWKFSEVQPMDAGDFGIEDRRTLTLRAGFFQRGNLNVQVTYQAGFALPYEAAPALGVLPLPSDLAQAALMTVEWLYQFRADRRVGVSGKSKDQENINFRAGLPPEIREFLAPHARLEMVNLSRPIENL
jgi:hypothetical protein